MPTRFDTMLQAGWRDRVDRGLFRYNLGDLQTRILPGPHRFVAQLNPLRATQRRQPQEILSIRQEFSSELFNFNKVKPEEVVLELVKDSESSRVVVLVNVSPLEFGHCLLVPDPSRCLPQVLTRSAVQAGMESVLLSGDPAFRVGFNSLGAFASVNHLHLHSYYLDHELNIESTPGQPLVPERGFHSLQGFPQGFLFYAEPDRVEDVAGAVCQLTDFLVENNTAHNVFMTRGCPPYHGDQESRQRRDGLRVAVWPRLMCLGAKEDSAFNIALCELAGHLPFRTQRDYELATEKYVTDTIQKFLLPDAEFLSLQQQLTRHLNNS